MEEFETEKDPRVEERARREAENKRKLQAAREKFDDRVEGYPVGKHGILIVKFADRTRIKFFHKKIREVEAEKNEEAKELLDEQLVLDCAVEPTEKAAVKAIFDDYPYLIPKAAMAILQLSGAGVEPLGKD